MPVAAWLPFTRPRPSPPQRSLPSPDPDLLHLRNLSLHQTQALSTSETFLTKHRPSPSQRPHPSLGAEVLSTFFLLLVPSVELLAYVSYYSLAGNLPI